MPEDGDPDEVDERDAERLFRWRLDAFKHLGYSEEVAERLALSTADPHEVERLLAAGCSRDLAARIAG